LLIIIISISIISISIIIIKSPNQAIALTPSAPRPTVAAERWSIAPLCLQLLFLACCGDFVTACAAGVVHWSCTS
jgi:hypothetical protein